MKYLLVLLKGMAMGAADVVPGVSGGTIAFITGIYDKLLDSISAVNFGLLKVIKNEGIVAAWNKINGTFLLCLFAGIGISIVSLAKVFSGLLDTHPTQLWAFFFGLIIASIFYIGKQVKAWNIKTIVGLLIGTAIVVTVSILPAMGNTESLAYLFLCGVIAICAMILPGISGSFLLLILGAYPTIMNAVSDRDFLIIGVVALGCLVGLLSFARILKWIFKNYERVTLAVLTGFLVGSLYKLWPWRHIEKIYVKHAGEVNEAGVSMEEVVTLKDVPVLPGDYDIIERSGSEIVGYTTADPNVLACVALAIAGFSLIFIMEFAAKKLGKDEE